MNDLEESILQVFDAYRAAVFAKDVDGFVGLYDQDVYVFDMWGEWSYTGIEAWRGMVAEWFGSLGSERVAVDMDGVQTLVTHDLAVAHAFVSYKSMSAEGNQLRAMHNRLTWALRQRGSVWKIVHEHSSAPVDFETLKVMLQR